MSKTTKREQLKEYLRTGDIPADENDLPNFDLNTLQAIYYRRQAIAVAQDPNRPEAAFWNDELFHEMPTETEIAANPMRAFVAEWRTAVDKLQKDSDEQPVSLDKALRQRSKEVYAHSHEVIDPAILKHLFDLEQNIDLEPIGNLLRLQGYGKGDKKLPIFANTPEDIRSALQKDFDFNIIPVDQEFTDFEKVIRQGEVPDWYRYMVNNLDDPEFVPLLSTLKERWFLFLIVAFAIGAVASFTFDLGVEIGRLTQDFILYLSLYGGVALTRAIWQAERAERWHTKAISYNRPAYVDALVKIAETEVNDDGELAKEIRSKGEKIQKDAWGWDEFAIKIGLEKGKLEKKSLVKQVAEATGKTRDQIINQIAKKVIKEKLDDDPKSLAVVIPTYQVTLEEMERLLVSIRDQAYPVGKVFVVYNDDPNESQAKQQEYLKYQEVVDRMNARTDTRNDCEIVLQTQPARGKREAMMMGFLNAMGPQYKKYLEKNLVGKMHQVINANKPDANDQEREQMIQSMLNTVFANVNISALKSDGPHQYLDVEEFTGQYNFDRVLNIDSDTEIGGPFAILTSELMMRGHEKDGIEVGCITGDVRVSIRDFNWLTEQTYQRYWTAFFKERGAQSLTGEVTCMSGPWVYMDTAKLAEILIEWYLYEHMAGRATFGDDREISTRMLQHGYASLFCPDSVVKTDCPTDYKTWLKQQLRWNKSFTIYNLLMFEFIHKLSKFVQLDVLYQQTFPFALLIILGSVSQDALQVALEDGPIEGLLRVLPYAITILLYNEIFFGVYGTLRNKIENEDGEFKRDYKFLYSPMYIYYHFRYLLWIKLYSFYDLFIKKNTSWGTKGAQFDEAQLSQFSSDPDALTDEILEAFEAGNGQDMIDEITDEILRMAKNGELDENGMKDEE